MEKRDANMNFMLNNLAGYGISFYLCPTENESTFSSAESPWMDINIIHYERDRRKKNFQVLVTKTCGIKKSLYLCSPDKTGAQE
ncbi:hypothetical protein EG359_17545 [Chryseobacterium joostei]|uniref:Uncharacterized protein n=1 Tax=Chryseobacterium joostei TaxID=112234 RepID=A0ABN5SCV2_9FLAO|nr:hypothetical protein EG359_14070 [Chryseobacterium joostei]AZB01309.1 hypothetical protein EG359_17545 [Chryseobacterium joostei]